MIHTLHFLLIKIERGAPDPTRVQTKGVYDMMKKVYLQGGIRGLFRGAGARVLFHTPSTAITMALFEACKKKWAEILSY